MAPKRQREPEAPAAAPPAKTTRGGAATGSAGPSGRGAPTSTAAAASALRPQAAQRPTPAASVDSDARAPTPATGAPPVLVVKRKPGRPKGSGKKPLPPGHEPPPPRAGPRDSYTEAVAYLQRRLADAGSPQAATMGLRPALRRAQAELSALMHKTVESGQSVSMLVYGEPGVGKTLAIERAIAAVKATYNTDAASPTVGVVRLSGLLHTGAGAAAALDAAPTRSFDCAIFAFHAGRRPAAAAAPCRRAIN
jgi:hypothetical protein